MYCMCSFLTLLFLILLSRLMVYSFEKRIKLSTLKVLIKKLQNIFTWLQLLSFIHVLFCALSMFPLLSSIVAINSSLDLLRICRLTFETTIPWRVDAPKRACWFCTQHMPGSIWNRFRYQRLLLPVVASAGSVLKHKYL